MWLGWFYGGDSSPDSCPKTLVAMRQPGPVTLHRVGAINGAVAPVQERPPESYAAGPKNAVPLKCAEDGTCDPLMGLELAGGPVGVGQPAFADARSGTRTQYE